VGVSVKQLPREDIPPETLPERLLEMALYWRNCAAQSSETWRSDMMRATAEELETTEANAIRQTQGTQRVP